MQVEIKHLDLVSVMKVCFVLYAVLGIVAGFIYLVVALVLSGLLDYGEAFEQSGLVRVAATGFGVLLVPVLALMYGCFGAVGGLIFALLYNLISRTIGGIRVSLAGEVVAVKTTEQAKDVDVRL